MFGLYALLIEQCENVLNECYLLLLYVISISFLNFLLNILMCLFGVLLNAITRNGLIKKNNKSHWKIRTKLRTKQMS